MGGTFAALVIGVGTGGIGLVVIGACAPNMQRKMFKEAFKDAGLDLEKDAVMLDIRDMTNQQAMKKVAKALSDMGLDADEEDY